MISSSRQLKDKVRNISDGNSNKASTLIRNFMMERFLERVSISSYRDNFILKGGMLVASIVGVDMRATMDIDTTVKALPLNEADVQRIIEEICNIPLEDNVSFQIKSTRTIMEEFDYPGIRVMLEATLDRMRQPIKIDISTDDVITPKAIEYDYKLMFEDRTISVLTYNKETLLAEKMQTIINIDMAIRTFFFEKSCSFNKKMETEKRITPKKYKFLSKIVYEEIIKKRMVNNHIMFIHANIYNFSLFRMLHCLYH